MLLKGFSMNDPLTLLGRILVLCCIILSAPVLHFPCRKAIIVGIWGSEALPGGPKFSMTKWISTMVSRVFQKANNESFLKICILSSVIVMVLYVPNIKDVFGLAGATVATLLMIVMPSGLHFKVLHTIKLSCYF
jgi:sodium-coupled neutral amino acid transporter 3